MRVKHLLALLGIAAFVAACGPDTKTDPNADAATRLGRPDPRTSWSDFTNPGRNGYADRVFFDLDQHDVRPDQEPTVRAWADWLRAHPGASFMIEGHCDERGTREYNLGLGDRRANSAKNFLVSLGVDARRVAMSVPLRTSPSVTFVLPMSTTSSMGRSYGRFGAR